MFWVKPAQTCSGRRFSIVLRATRIGPTAGLPPDDDERRDDLSTLSLPPFERFQS